MILLMGISLLSVSFCTKYNPSFYPGYDTLNPSEEVRKNPVGVVTVVVIIEADGNKTYKCTIWTDQELKDGKGYFVVDEHFMMHYKELWLTVEKLMELVK